MAIAAVAATVMLLLAGAASSAPAQYEGRSFTVVATPAKASVGDSIRLTFRLVIHERDLLTDTVPRPVAELPEGLRVYAVEKLRRGADRVFTGEAVVAFYRPGTLEIPAFGVSWVQIVTGRRGTIASDAATVEIVPVLPAGSPTLKDIREIDAAPGPGPVPLFLAGIALAALAVWLLRGRRRESRPAQTPPPPPEPPAPPDPYRDALARLDRLGRRRLAAPEEIVTHYEEVADTLRAYLEAAEEIPARERTSTELLWALPPRLTEAGLRRLAAQVLGEADMVKFARSRPDDAAAAAYLAQARELLRRWHAARAAAPAEEREPDAVR